MNKTDLAEALHQAGHGPTKAASRAIVESVLGALAEALVAGEPVHLAGFGNLDLRLKGARAGQVAGRAYDRAARYVVRFRAAQALTERLPRPTPVPAPAAD